MLFAMIIERFEGLWFKLPSLPASLAWKLASVIDMVLPQSKQHSETLVASTVVASPLVSSCEPLPEKMADSVHRIWCLASPRVLLVTVS